VDNLFCRFKGNVYTIHMKSLSAKELLITYFAVIILSFFITDYAFAYDYVRTPGGTEVSEANISLTWSDFATEFGVPDIGYMQVGLFNSDPYLEENSTCFATSGGVLNYTFNPPEGQPISSVYFLTSDNAGCVGNDEFGYLEGDDSETTFTIVAEEETNNGGFMGAVIESTISTSTSMVTRSVANELPLYSILFGGLASIFLLNVFIKKWVFRTM